jgi:hypothetical protein
MPAEVALFGGQLSVYRMTYEGVVVVKANARLSIALSFASGCGAQSIQFRIEGCLGLDE